MKSLHTVLFKNASGLKTIKDESVSLVVTSPPYPMIEMWDTIFSAQDSELQSALKSNDGNLAFNLMHQILDPIWEEVYRVLQPGGFACINIGDATRTIDKHFRLYANHARILQHCLQIGFTNLPPIIWRKQTNAPNKFMGSGMLPAGAYVTLEHEFVLILRKGNKREFKTAAEKQRRNQSGFFWEERNTWFSDIWWDLKGAGQKLNHSNLRERSGAFPFELAYRLINMYSVKGDTVLDPFLGTGTTTFAAIASNRNSIGFEIDPKFHEIISNLTTKILSFSDSYMQNRLSSHIDFVKNRLSEKKPLKHINKVYGFPVMTKQEREINLDPLIGLEEINNSQFEVSYSENPHSAFCKDWAGLLEQNNATAPNPIKKKSFPVRINENRSQQKLF
jgi:DNA modification methylase